MGIPLLTGRDFTSSDTLGSEQVTIVTKPLADQLFPKGGPGEAIGKRLTFGIGTEDTPAPTLTIVGVAADFPTSGMDSPREQLLRPLAQLNLPQSPSRRTRRAHVCRI